MKILWLLTLVLTISCNSKSSPEKVLRSFEQELAKGEVTKSNLKEWLSEDALSRFKLDPRTINKTYLKKFEIIYSNCVNEICSYTYDVSYKIKNRGVDAIMDVRKQAVLSIQQGSRWLISELDIIKSYIDNKNPIKI
jgi:hypothetical protein